MIVASIVASAVDPVKLALSFGLVLGLRRFHIWMATVLGVGLLAYILIAVGSSDSPGTQLQIHFASSIALVGLAALVLKLTGNMVGSAIGVAMSAASLGAVWFAISASTAGGAASTNDQAMATSSGHLSMLTDGPAHTFLVAGAIESTASQPEFRWLSRQPEEYQAAIYRGELPEPESEQRKIGLLILGIRHHYGQDEDISAFLLSSGSLPFLVELRSLLQDQLKFVDDGEDVSMLLHTSAVRISSRVQSILEAIQSEAKL